ncbi:MAG: hypothetical protein COV60_00980 [Candidatus Magasanikbacteria bacterium CG11_big_fil_rev_8_21_14_0_20_43_7]|uniref:Uncharacterized protein n=1 Tax=Candidatus Magasanikbacteria bacterium CG11_big_fil_rev_8_21_14_0_20_43_7 TaxID=1974654 RepID=A0A2H0N335_9BACT|nr:MAG: hypothetical protein COV60_00980 [Candidatus Magasanikbacteria bacterium CG11_big_fil_rev_8_21_14_0_20_43_7]
MSDFGEKVLALSMALRESGLYPGPSVHDFLRGRGVTADAIMARGGWMFILMDILMEEGKTIEELIDMIRDQR